MFATMLSEKDREIVVKLLTEKETWLDHFLISNIAGNFFAKILRGVVTLREKKL